MANNWKITSLGLFAAAFLWGCVGKSEPSRFYILATPESLRTEIIRGPSSGASIRLGIGPIKMRSHLKRPQMLSKISTYRVDLAEFDRWAEPLEENVTQVLAENLSVVLSTDDIVVFPWNRAIPIDYQLTLEVIRFDTDNRGQAYLISRWQLFGENGKKFLFSRRSSFQAPVFGTSHEARTAALSKILGDMSKEIGTVVFALSRERR